MDALLLLLLVLSVVIGLQAVGVVLMAAMLITPAAAARFWTERLDRMVLLAGLYGGLSGAIGTYFSTLAPRMPTGPLIVLAATVLFLCSLLLAPQRGLFARALRLAAVRAQVAQEGSERDSHRDRTVV
jgi:manganese/zinc/iron transport system permease protein